MCGANWNSWRFWRDFNDEDYVGIPILATGEVGALDRDRAGDPLRLAVLKPRAWRRERLTPARVRQ